MSELAFDTAGIPAEAPLEAVPAGKYSAMIIESEVVPNSGGTGTVLKLKGEIVDGPFKGRKFWDNLNIRHENQQTQQISQSRLSAICQAVGKSKIRDSAELHDFPLRVTLAIKNGRNTVKGYEPYSHSAAATNAPTTQAHTETQAAVPAPQSSGKPPWQR